MLGTSVLFLIAITALTGVQTITVTGPQFTATQCTVPAPSGSLLCNVSGLVNLQPGPSVLLPALTVIVGHHGRGRDSAPAGCAITTSTNGSDPCPSTDAASAVPVLQLPPTSTAFSVPPNGSLELRDIRLTTAVLPVKPYPLPSASFLSLSAFRLGTGAKLRLENVVVTATSCAALSLHQSFACSFGAWPNASVTSTSLLVHRLSTASLEANNVTIICSEAALPFPCLAAVVSSGQELADATSAAARDWDSAYASTAGESRTPVYIFINRSLSLADGRCGGSQCSNIPITSRTVLAGTAGGATVLDLGGIASYFKIGYNEGLGGSVEVRNVTLRNLPVGPPEILPLSLVRLSLWTFGGFVRQSLGGYAGALLVEDVTVELPPEEVAMWFGDAGIAPPPRLARCQCVADAIADPMYTLFMPFSAESAQDSSDPESLRIIVAEGYSLVFTYTRMLLRPDWSHEEPTGGTGGVSVLAPAAATGSPSGTSNLLNGDFGSWTSGSLPGGKGCGAYPSICQLLPPGVGTPLPFKSVRTQTFRRLVLPRDFRLKVDDTALPLVLAYDVAFAASPPDNPFAGPGFGQVQASVAYPALLLGDPLGPRYVDLTGLPSVVLVSGPRALLTLRSLVLLNAPAAGPRLLLPSLPPPPGIPPVPVLAPSQPSPPFPGGQLDASGASASAGRRSRGLRGVSGSAWSLRLPRRVQQQEGARASPPAAPVQVPSNLASGNAAGTVMLGDLEASLANFTSCLWTFDFNRRDVGNAYVWAQSTPGNGSSRLVGMPYVFLDSVVLVIPQRELSWLARVWALADAIGSLDYAPVGVEPVLLWAVQQLLSGSTLSASSSMPAAGSSASSTAEGPASLTFEVMSWCGLLGRNVTLTSAAPAQTRFYLQPRDLMFPELTLQRQEPPSPDPGAPSGPPPPQQPQRPPAPHQAPHSPVDLVGRPTTPNVNRQPPRSPLPKPPYTQAHSPPSSTVSAELPQPLPNASATGLRKQVIVAIALPCAAAAVGAAVAVAVLARARRRRAHAASASHKRSRTASGLSLASIAVLLTDGWKRASGPRDKQPHGGKPRTVRKVADRVGVARLGPTGRAAAHLMQLVEERRQAAAADTSSAPAFQQENNTAMPLCSVEANSLSAPGASHTPPSTLSVFSGLRNDAAAELRTGPTSGAGSPILRIVGELGRGAQGVVYRGVWRGLDVAVKSVLFQHAPRLGGTDPRSGRAVAEAAISTRLSHANIVATYTYELQRLGDTGGANPGLPPTRSARASNPDELGAQGVQAGDEVEVWKLTLIQELCDLNSLRHCLRNGTLLAPAAAQALGASGSGANVPVAAPLRLLPLRTVLSLARDTATGMAHLHSKGVVHADLSSSNVLLQSRKAPTAQGPSGGAGGGQIGGGTEIGGAAAPAACGYVAKVCDFGLSGRLDPQGSATHLSGPARRSSAYSPPELVRHGRAGPKGDVYAFGVLLWELALGLPLPAALARPEGAALRTWLAEQSQSTSLDAVAALPPNCLVWPPHVPRAYRALAETCLHAQPKKRPTFAVVLERLGSMLRKLRDV